MIEEDFDCLFDDDLFSELIQHTPLLGPIQNDLSAIINRPFIDLFRAVSSTEWTLHIQLAAFVTPPQKGDGIFVTADSKNFTVKHQPETDETGRVVAIPLIEV